MSITGHRVSHAERHVSEDEPQGDVEVLCTGALGRKRMVVFKVRNTGSRRAVLMVRHWVRAHKVELT